MNSYKSKYPAAILSVGALLGAYGIAVAGHASVGPGHVGSVETPRGCVEVTPLGNSIFKVTHLPVGKDVPFAESQSAILQPQENNVTSALFSDFVELNSPAATVRIDRKTGKVSFYTPQGELLVAEADGIDNSDDFEKRVTLLNVGKQNFFGAGERGHAPRLNGDSLTMFNRQNYGYTYGDPRISQMGISIPYFVSDKGYGVLFDDYSRGELILGNDTITYRSQTPLGLSYYVVTGEDGSNLDALTNDYTRLTGRQNLPPFWSLGYVTSKYGYKTRREAEEVVDRLKKAGYPLDGMVFDLYWYGVEQDMGRFAWDETKWPGHSEMVRNLKDKGVNLVLISQPYINKGGAIDNYNYLAANGMLAKNAEGEVNDVTTWVGDAGMLDVSNPKTREWIWSRLRELGKEGIAGYWGDLGEPEVHPLTILHANGQTAEQYHNVYGNEWSRLIYEGVRKDFPDQRPLLMMRGGTAGLQRYSVFPWTTDVSRSWGGLQPQVNLMLSSGLSGLAYMGSDIGGFAVDPENPKDDELYVRWLQMGTFSPMLRTHAQENAEPFNYPKVENILKEFINMRYRWLPYNYTLAYENAQFGYPLGRPLNFRGENPDEKYSKVEDEYMWGDEVLVAPVMTKGARSRKVLFPAGTWYDWNNPSRTFKGGTTATVAAPLNQLPLFIKAGSFIPQYDRKIENVAQYDPQTLSVLYFPSSEESSYTLFDDDRLSPTSLQDGRYQLTIFKGVRNGREVKISIGSNGGSYEGMPPYRQLTFEVIDMTAAPKGVTASNGIELPRKKSIGDLGQSGWYHDAKTKRLYIRLPWEYESLTLTAN